MYDMMGQLGVSQRYMANCSVTSVGDWLFVCTSQGVDEQHNTSDAPSFICLQRETGQLVWADNTPSLNVLHGQWSSPACAELGGVLQVIFGGGDGWLSFDAAERTGSRNCCGNSTQPRQPHGCGAGIATTSSPRQ